MGLPLKPLSVWVERVQQYINHLSKQWPAPVNYILGADSAEPMFRERIPGMVFSIYHFNEGDVVPSGEATEMFVPFPEEFTVADIMVACEATVSENLLFGMIGKP